MHMPDTPLKLRIFRIIPNTGQVWFFTITDTSVENADNIDIPEKIPHAKIHWKTVKKIHLGIMDEFLKKRKEVRLRSGYKPTYLAVDEFAYTKPPLTFYDNIPYLLTLLRNWILCLPRF